MFAVSADENAARILSMNACNYLLQEAEDTEFVTFQDSETNVNKVQLLINMFDSLKKHSVLRPLILSWMNEAVRESMYDPLTYSPASSISSEPSSEADSQASHIASFEYDFTKAKQFGQVIAFWIPLRSKNNSN